MDTTLTKPQLWQQWRDARQLGLLAAFEDSITGTRVKEFCQGLSRDLGQQCRITEHVWLFSTLRLRELREIAAEEASASDLVIVYVHQAEHLPDEVKSWIDLWLQHKGNHSAVLLVLLDPADEDTPGPMQVYLQDVARRAGIVFLAESSEGPGRRW
jgi:hypothetical protein